MSLQKEFIVKSFHSFLLLLWCGILFDATKTLKIIGPV